MGPLLKFSLTVVAMWLLIGNTEASSWLGGANKERPADDEVRAMVKELEPEIKKAYPGNLIAIEPLFYRTQVVAGTNYLIKAKVTDSSGKQSLVHLRLWSSLFNGTKFGAIRTKVDEQTPLDGFMDSDVGQN